MGNRVPIWRKTAPKRRDLRVFLANHNRTITFIGALIVFTTFIVKEAIGDNIKDLLGDVETAHNVYEIRHDTANLAAQLRVLQEGLQARNTSVESVGIVSQHATNANAYDQAVRDFEKAASQYVSDVSRYIQAARDLENAANSADYGSELMSNIWHDVNDPRLKSYVAGVDDRLQEIDRLGLGIDGLLKKEEAALHKLDVRPARSIGVQAESSLANFESRIRELVSDLNTHNEGTLAKAEDQRDKLESTYESTLMISYILYCIGWGFALIGRLYGAERYRTEQ